MIALLFFCALLTGCFDTKQEVTLNPDGTGKVVIESVFQQITPFLDKAEERGQLSNVTNVVRGIIESAEGVEAWRELSFHQRDDGRAFFKGTAYFRSLDKLKLPLVGVGNQKWSTRHDASGNLTITSLGMLPSEDPIRRTNGAVTIESIRRERTQFQGLHPLLATTVGESKQEVTIHLPGTLLRATNFDTNTAFVLKLKTDGRKILAAMENRLFDPSLEARRLAGEEISSWDDQMRKLVYGEAGPVVAVIKPASKPRFDFDEEVASARADFATADYFGLNKVVPTLITPIKNGTPAKATVIGVESKQAADAGRLYGEQSAYFEMKVQAELAGEIFSASNAKLDRAVTLEGNQLSEITRPHHALMLPGRTNVTFLLRMTPPPMQSTGFAEVSGTIECIGPVAVNTVELISGKLRGGTKGTLYDATIEDVIPNLAGGNKLLLRTTLKPEQLRFPRVVGEDGRTAELQIRKHESFGEAQVYTLANRQGIPRSGKLVAQVLEGTQTLRIPFSLTNLNLLGQPR